MRGLVLGAWLVLLTPQAAPADLTSIKRSVVADYATVAYATYQDALEGARSLAGCVDSFLAAPGEDSLNHARQAWIDARIPYAQTEAFRFYDGPIDAVEGFINSWPIDETLIDYVEGDRQAGIVNHPDRYGAITTALIVSLNEKGGEKNITAGYHAIEFLLWGQDFDENGPGQRPYLDYVDGRGANAARRRDYLQAAAHLLVGHLQMVHDAWAPGQPSNYRAKFLALPPDDALACIVKGMGILSGS